MNAQATLQRHPIASIEANIASTLDEIAARQPDLAALIEGSRRHGKVITYKTLAKRVARKSGALRDAGLRSGDLVLMLQPMSIDLYVSILAVFRAGASVLIIDAAAGRDKLEHAIASTNPRAVIAAGKGLFAAFALRSVRHIELKFSDGLTLPGWHSLKSQWFHLTEGIHPVQPSHPALITLTSGTSGKSKMIVRSHEFLRKQLQAVSDNCDVREGSCEFTSLPVFVLANLASCVTTILPDANLAKMEEADLEPVIAQLTTYKPDRILASPILVERIVSECRRRAIRLPHVDTIITGGGPVFPRLMKSAKQVFPNAKLLTVYGSSEAEPIAKIDFNALTPHQIDAIAGGAGLPVGFPVQQIKIRIEPLIERDSVLTNADRLAAFRHVCCLAEIPLHAVGEILVTGEHVVKGYAGGIGDAETKVRINGEIWHRTGDVGYFDRDGRLWLTGRINKNCVDTTLAQCVEAAALSDDSIDRAACLTVNNVTTLFVETREQSRFTDLWLVKNRLNWSQLAAVKVVHKIPVDTRHSSKVLYEKLAESA